MGFLKILMQTIEPVKGNLAVSSNISVVFTHRPSNSTSVCLSQRHTGKNMNRHVQWAVCGTIYDSERPEERKCPSVECEVN